MDKDCLYRQALVWLEHEEIRLRNNNNMRELFHRHRGKEKGRERLAESLANHLWNNWRQVELAQARKSAS